MLRRISLLLVTVLAAASCGSGGDDPSAVPAESAATAAADSEPGADTASEEADVELESSPTTAAPTTTEAATTTSSTTTVAPVPGEAWAEFGAVAPGIDDETSSEFRNGFGLGPAPRAAWWNGELLWIRPKQQEAAAPDTVAYSFDRDADAWVPQWSWTDFGIDPQETFRAGVVAAADLHVGLAIGTDHPDPFRRELALYRIGESGVPQRLDTSAVPDHDIYRFDEVRLTARANTVIAASQGAWVSVDQVRFGTPTDPLLVTCIAGDCRVFVSTLDRDGPGFFWLSDTAVGDSALVAVGNGSVDGAANRAMAFVSLDDGQSWQPTQIAPAVEGAPSSSARAVDWGDAGFVAIGETDRTVAGWRSVDGLTWERFDPVGLDRVPDEGAALEWAMGGYWLLDGDRLHASADGVTWRTVEIPSVSDFWTRQVAFGERIALVGDEGLALSPP